MAFENGRISNFQAPVTLTLDRVILHTVMHHSLTSTYVPNFINIEETSCGRTDGHLRPILLGGLRVDLKIKARISHLSTTSGLETKKAYSGFRPS